MRLLLMLACLLPPAVAAEQTYQQPDAFVAETFAGNAPEPSVLWITGTLRDQAGAILGHPPGALRTRYWRKNRRTAWVLEETGKEEPITVGLVVQDGQLEAIKVLVYRESRGWEIRHDFFTRQFSRARLRDDSQLDRHIDGITGATLSVNAMRRLARLALLYHRHVTADAAH
jgi:hypothetical protein